MLPRLFFFHSLVNMRVYICSLRSLICQLLVLSVCLSGSAAVWAYEESTVSNGGTVKGTVQLYGEPPAPASFDLSRFPDRVYCGALSDGSGFRLLRTVTIGKNQGLKDVVVTIENVEKGKPFELTETNLEANICQFVPFVSIMRDNHPLIVKNLDPVSHDLQFYERDREHVFIMFHRPSLTRTGTRDMIRFTGQRRDVTMQCGFHPYMQGHGLAVDNPYYAITDVDGTFEIKEIPAGTYRVKAWHPTLGEKVQNVTVAANGTTSLDINLEAK